MDGTVKTLIAYQKDNNLCNREMAELLGAPMPQYYTNWIARDSIPKKYWNTAFRLTGTHPADNTPLLPDKQEPYSLFRMMKKDIGQLTNKQLQTIITVCTKTLAR